VAQLRAHLSGALATYNLASLKMPGGLAPSEYIREISPQEPDRFIRNPIHQFPGLNSQVPWWRASRWPLR
jgi:hypothetical protein